MAEIVWARTLAEGFEQYEWLIDDDCQHGSLQDLAVAANNNPVIFLVSASDVLLMEINLPVKNRRLLKKALPFALEDWLTQDVDQYHLAWSPQYKDRVLVAAIAHETMQHRVNHFQTAAINLQAIYPETLLLPLQQDGAAVLIDRGRAIVRYGNCSGGGIDSAHLPMLLEKVIAENQQIRSVRIWTTELMPELVLDKNIGIESKLILSGLAFLIDHKQEPLELNLLSSPYSQNDKAQKNWQVWLPSIALILMAFVWQFGVALNNYWSYKDQLLALQTQNQQLFKQTFPNIKRLVNLKTQAEQEMLTLKKMASPGGAEFLNLIYHSGEILKQTPLLQLQEINFTNDVLTIRLTATALAEIEQFKQQLENQNAMSVKIQTAEANDKGFWARLEITRKSS